MAAPSSDSEPAPEPDPAEQETAGGIWNSIPGHALWDGTLWDGSLWRGHHVELAKATAIDLALLAGHLLLYPTGFLPERVPGPPPRPTAGTDRNGAGQGTDRNGAAHGTDRDGTGQTAPPRPRGSREGGAGRAGGRSPALLPSEGRGHPPVLMLHGFVDNRSAFALLRRSLLRHGWTRVQALNYSPLTGDIRTAAAMLGPHIERVCEESGHSQVDIIGHSLGGLVGRYYVQRLGGHSRVRTLVTMGTPHTGTRAVPPLAPHPLARQMRPGSPVLEELAAPVPGCRTRFVAFWSDLDEFMIPVESARLEHPDLSTANVKVTGVGHLALPVYGSVAAEVRRVLSGPGPARDAIDAA